MNISKHNIALAKKNAKSYKEFKSNLEELGCKVPYSVSKFPFGLGKGWIRKLRYEFNKDIRFGKHATGHDLRQANYYLRLVRLGHSSPEFVMQ